jgi:hypothetical protein
MDDYRYYRLSRTGRIMRDSNKQLRLHYRNATNFIVYNLKCHPTRKNQIWYILVNAGQFFSKRSADPMRDQNCYASRRCPLMINPFCGIAFGRMSLQRHDHEICEGRCTPPSQNDLDKHRETKGTLDWPFFYPFFVRVAQVDNRSQKHLHCVGQT